MWKKCVELARERAKGNRGGGRVEGKGYEIWVQGMRPIPRGTPEAGRVIPDWSIGPEEGIGRLTFGGFGLYYNIIRF